MNLIIISVSSERVRRKDKIKMEDGGWIMLPTTTCLCLFQEIDLFQHTLIIIVHRRSYYIRLYDSHELYFGHFGLTTLGYRYASYSL